jgi:hypothetical protein
VDSTSITVTAYQHVHACFHAISLLLPPFFPFCSVTSSQVPAAVGFKTSICDNNQNKGGSNKLLCVSATHTHTYTSARACRATISPLFSQMSTRTVKDVFIGCLPCSVTQNVSASQVVQAVKLWITQHDILRASMTAEGFFAQPDTFGWAASPALLLYWSDVVAAKFLKFAASEYAYLHVPADGGTTWLTAKTAQLVTLQHLRETTQQILQDLSKRHPTLPLR